jgi:hypothetical protein
VTDEGNGNGHKPSRDWVALTLAIGLATAVNLIVIGVLLAAYYRGKKSGDYSISENATQVLIAAFGGMIGVLGGYVGGSSVAKATTRSAERDQMLLNAQPIDDSVQKVDIIGTVETTEAPPEV